MKYKTRRVTIDAGDVKLKLLILSPCTADEGIAHPGVLWIHGGWYVTGMSEMVYMSRAKALVSKYGAVVISPEYRLSGKAPYPAALYDCHNALLYLRDHTKELGVREDQLMVGGESAGGGLAAALCMYEKDIGGVSIAFQMPLYPMIDNEDTETSRDNHAPVWNTRRNHHGWSKYLSGISDDKTVPCYAAPARRKDYTGLPPAYTFICTAEPFYAETMAYIENLKKAGVPARVDIYKGLFHSFDMLMPYLKVSRIAAARFEKSVEYAVKNYFAKQKRE